MVYLQVHFSIHFGAEIGIQYLWCTYRCISAYSICGVLTGAFRHTVFVVYLQVHFGIHFGAEIDMWSIGCILAEIYLGQPLIFGTTKMDILQSVSTFVLCLFLCCLCVCQSVCPLSLSLSVSCSVCQSVCLPLSLSISLVFQSGRK